MAAENKCNILIETLVGDWRIVEEKKSYSEAKDHCKNFNATLAPLKTEEQIDLASEALTGCSRTRAWTVGLKLDQGRWSWADGTLFNLSEQGKLLVKNPLLNMPSSCLEFVLTPITKKLDFQPCGVVENNFLCLLNLNWRGIGIENRELELSSTLIGYIVLVALGFLLVAWLVLEICVYYFFDEFMFIEEDDDFES